MVNIVSLKMGFILIHPKIFRVQFTTFPCGTKGSTSGSLIRKNNDKVLIAVMDLLYSIFLWVFCLFVCFPLGGRGVSLSFFILTFEMQFHFTFWVSLFCVSYLLFYILYHYLWIYFTCLFFPSCFHSPLLPLSVFIALPFLSILCQSVCLPSVVCALCAFFGIYAL